MRDRVRLRDAVGVTDGVEEDRGVEVEGEAVKEGEDVEFCAEQIFTLTSSTREYSLSVVWCVEEIMEQRVLWPVIGWV